MPVPVTAAGGLSMAEVASRRAAGQGNTAPTAESRSVGAILARNTFTWLNLLLVTLGVAALATGSVPDAAFLVIAVVNTVVGAVQEVRAKRTLDRLAVVNAARTRVHRDGALVEVATEDLVIDDVVEMRAGDQVPADAVMVDGQAEVDESLATGESDPVPKAAGDALVSGTWLVGGSLVARITAVGADSYATRLASEARQFSLTGSELVQGVNRVLRWLSVLMLLVGPVLLWRQLQIQPWRTAVRAATAGLVGMVPEGLVLLTTLAFLSAAVRLGRQRVLVQELPAVEGLARVDVLCTDKTGTLTYGRVAWGGLILPPVGGDDGGTGRAGGSDAQAALAELVSGPDANATLRAIRDGVGVAPGWERTHQVTFSSARKWSGASYAGRGSWALGAPEMVDAADPGGLREVVAQLAGRGRRVLVLARGDVPFSGNDLPAGMELVAAVELREQVRPDASDTLRYLAAQGVTVRVVSGDAASTVGAVAAEVGLPDAGRPVDARRCWPEDPAQLDRLIEAHTVFGRVTPDQKRAMIDSLRRRGHVIAMTGDGVNDTLALKDADLGIAMGSGSPVARGVAQLVLLDDQFDVLPAVLGEGRRVLHNIEQVASLFLVKNVYSLVISVVVAAAGWPYPYLPRHLSLVSGVAIGIPSFFLAFAASDQRFRPGFLGRVLHFSIVAGTVTAVAVLLAYAGARHDDSAPDAARTAAMIVTVIVSLWVLALAARPFKAWKAALVAAMAAILTAAFVVPGVDTFFNLQHHPGPGVLLEAVLLAAAACALISLVTTRRRR